MYPIALANQLIKFKLFLVKHNFRLTTWLTIGLKLLRTVGYFRLDFPSGRLILFHVYSLS